MPDEPNLPDGWGVCVHPDTFAAQLRREVSKGHKLFGRTLEAFAVRDDCDDALFRGLEGELVVVHLTWRQGAEAPPWPLIVWESTTHTLREFAAWSIDFYGPER